MQPAVPYGIHPPDEEVDFLYPQVWTRLAFLAKQKTKIGGQDTAAAHFWLVVALHRSAQASCSDFVLDYGLRLGA